MRAWLERPFTDQRAGQWFLGVALVILLASGLGSSLLTPYDDAFFGYAAKRLAQDGEWLGLKTRDGLLLEKPPLAVWLQAPAVAWLGPTTAAVRLPGVLVAALGIAAAYRLMRRSRGHAEALLFALVLTTSQQVLHFARRPVTEIFLLVWIMLALACYATVWTRRGGHLATAVFVALAVMTKGVVGLIPFGVIAVHLAVTRSWTGLRGRRLWLTIGLAILLAAPWHVAMVVRHGDEFVYHYFWQTQLSFITGTSHLDPWHWSTILRKIAENYWPWLPALLVGLAAGLRWAVPRDARRPDSGDEWRHVTLVLVWLLSILTFFHLTYVKRHQYVLPAYPAMALLIAWWFERSRRRRVWRCATTAFVTAAMVAALVPGVWPSLMDNNLYGDKREAVRALAAGTAVPVGDEVLVLDGEAGYCFACDIVAYYTDAAAQPYSPQRLLAAVARGEVVTVLVHARQLDQLAADLPTGWRLQTIHSDEKARLVAVVPGSE